MIDELQRADAFKVVLKERETLAEKPPPVEENVCYSEKREHFPLFFSLFESLGMSLFFFTFLRIFIRKAFNIFLISFVKRVYNWNLRNDFKICFVAVVSDIEVVEDSDKDVRWYPVYEDLELPRTDAERQEELRKLTKPFLHDLHIWYSKNKPTKLFTPVRQIGKKAMPERRFSHL